MKHFDQAAFDGYEASLSIGSATGDELRCLTNIRNGFIEEGRYLCGEPATPERATILNSLGQIWTRTFTDVGNTLPTAQPTGHGTTRHAGGGGASA